MSDTDNTPEQPVFAAAVEPVITPAPGSVKVYRPEDAEKLTVNVRADDLADWIANGWKAVE
jgi:hypothetical protein